jgi:TetR/AcrR family transcriptional regulator, cholesterol catabolism regulator
MAESARRGEPSRVERKRAERVARVERTAARVFAQRGYEGANLDEIAAQLDMRGPSLYYYFSSKEELFLRCVRTSADEVIGRLESVAARVDDEVARLQALFREQVLIEARDYPDFLPLFVTIRLPTEDLRERLLELRREHEEVFKRAAEQVRVARGLDRVTVSVALRVAFGALAYLQDWYDPAGPMDAEELADRFAATLIIPFLAVGSEGAPPWTSPA